MHASAPYNAGTLIRYVNTRLAEDGMIEIRIPEELLVQHAEEETKITDGWYSTGVKGHYDNEGCIVQSEPSQEAADGEKKDPVANELRTILEGSCHYITIVSILWAEGKEPVAVMIPRSGFFRHPDYRISPMDGCFCPRDMKELGKCLTGCLNHANAMITGRLPAISRFLIASERTNPE